MDPTNTPAGLGETPDRQSPSQSYSAADAQGLWRDWFGSSARAQIIASESDAVFRMSSSDGEAAFLLRIAADESDALALQAELLAHIAVAAPDLPTPRVRRNRLGELCTVLSPRNGRRHVAIATSFMPGAPLSKAPASPAMRRKVFDQLARLDAALAGFRHPAADRDLLWDVSHAGRVLPMIDHIPDPEIRALAQAALLDWETDISPHLGSLRHQVIHNDFNPSNLLVSDSGEVTGVIDFGDALWAPLVCEVATAAAYQAPEGGFGEMVAQAAGVYGARIPLSAQELALLPGLVRARAAMIVAIGHWRSLRVPANGAYLMRNVPAASRLLAAAAEEPSPRLLTAPNRMEAP